MGGAGGGNGAGGGVDVAYLEAVAEGHLRPSLLLSSILCAAYVLLTLWGKGVMAPLKPLKLRGFQRTYNAFQIALNAYMVYGLARNFSLTNPFAFNLPYDPVIEWYMTVHFWSKFADWVDTFIIVTRKKDSQLSFLHVFHHATIPLPWAITIIGGNAYGTTYFGAFINSVIHCIMYTHYLVTSYGVRNPFKRYLTKAQIVQFCFCVLHATLFVWCESVNMANPTLQLGYHLMMITLFGNFYRNNYSGAKELKETPAAAATAAATRESSQSAKAA
jgi:hypothetical protein